MSKRISDLDAHLGYWLRYVSNQVSHAFAVKVEAHGITVAEWVILRELFDVPEIAPSALSEKIGMTRGAVSKLAERLLAKSLIVRKSDKDDRRYQSLGLTAKGRALVPQLAALADKNDDEFFGDLKASERKQLETTMKSIVARLGLRTVPVD